MTVQQKNQTARDILHLEGLQRQATNWQLSVPETRTRECFDDRNTVRGDIYHQYFMHV